MRRLKTLMRKEFTHTRRDPRMLMFIFIMPILQLFLLDSYRAAGYFSLDYMTLQQSRRHAVD